MTPAEDADITAWALRAAVGDAQSQAAFIRATQAEVWRFCAALVSPGDADDLLQETYMRAFRALAAFAARSSARTWLLAIARRVCADHLRSLTRRRRLDAALRLNHRPVSTPDPAGEHGILALLNEVDSERAEAFALTQILQLSYAEAAEIVGVPVGTIRSRVARARADLIALTQQAARA